MRIVAAAFLMIALSCGAAYSQAMNLLTDQPRDPAKEEKYRTIDENYKATTSKIPEQKANADPWGNVRAPAAPAQKTKPASTGSK